MKCDVKPYHELVDLNQVSCLLLPGSHPFIRNGICSVTSINGPNVEISPLLSLLGIQQAFHQSSLPRSISSMILLSLLSQFMQ